MAKSDERRNHSLPGETTKMATMRQFFHFQSLFSNQQRKHDSVLLLLVI